VSQPNFPNYVQLPPICVRVRWIEEYTGLLDCVKETRTWAGFEQDGEGAAGDHLWCDATGYATVSEKAAVERGVTRDGTVLAFHGGTLLVACTDGRLLTLDMRCVRRIE
jgi:hypothetical protein